MKTTPPSRQKPAKAARTVPTAATRPAARPAARNSSNPSRTAVARAPARPRRISRAPVRPPVVEVVAPPVLPALESVLARVPVASPFGFALNSERAMRLDLAVGNTAFDSVNPSDPAAFGRWIGEQMLAAGARYAIGGYDENRSMYRMSDVFGTAAEEPRTLHLGLDLWLPATTPVFTVLGGVIHSVQDNRAFGDYGPTVIVEHQVEGLRFFTLYGHLARATLARVKAGQRLETGEALGWLGAPVENGGWPPHLHFQIIRDLDGRVGDYPGVCRMSERARWLERCPNPNLLLRAKVLK